MKKKLRPQILAVVFALFILGVLLVLNGVYDGALVAIVTALGMIAERILQSQDTPDEKKEPPEP